MARTDVALVAVGGVFGAAARDAVEQALPAGTGFPVATLVINLSGALALGLLLSVLLEGGRRVRLVVGTGFLGAWTTYSTFALESVQLVRADRAAVAVAYLAASILGGLVAAAVGLRLGPGPGRAPVDPDR